MTSLAQPQAKTIPHETRVHDDVLVDPYFWLRDRDHPDVLAHIEAENVYALQMMAPTQALQEQLYQELRGRIKETDLSVPERQDDFWYYSRVQEGQQYPIYCRKRGSLDAPEEILLDQNALVGDSAYCRIGVFQVSPDHRLLAYSVDLTGGEKYTLSIKDLESGQLLPDQIPNTYYSLEWASDNQTLFYVVIDEAMRPCRLLRHQLGTPAAEDQLIYFEPDERFYMELGKTKSQAFLLINLQATDMTEVHYLAADQPAGAFKVLQPRQPGHEYSVAHHGERFLIITNAEATNFKLVEAPVATPDQAHWRDLMPQRPGVLLNDIETFADYLVLYEREHGLKQIQIVRPNGESLGYVTFPEPVYTFQPHDNPEWTSTSVRFTYSSLVTPNSVIDYDLQTGAWEVRKQDEIPSGYDPTAYESLRITATAPDGVAVPISLVYQKPLVLDGARPLVLFGYGSYGINYDPFFDAERLSLLERGVIVAIAHIRGGQELGREWYNQGKLLNKKNTFTDFIACAEHLIAEGYTSSERLGISGGSAGGLLMGAVINMRPELFKSVVAYVPFVDVINTMLDPTLPLTVKEYDQWGNPNDPAFYSYIKSYSPYDNVRAQAYPHMLVTAGLNDPRVSYWEPAKWVARLRTLKTDQNLLLLKTNTEAGHGGASGRYDSLHETAFEYAFLLYTLGAVDIPGDNQ